ncbi:hypothetical protein [Nostocoides sp. F2B08]|uniref:hypothetical protein n=1 Tax=Nostocoides sp. F2B08 TaxID=2653936 RepID=UPI00186B38B4|nr:hypothetical protein [Tetrasphaera sp. F2B08]
MQSRRWLLSTIGAQFGHPDPEALARVVVAHAVKLPRKRRDGTYTEGISVTLRAELPRPAGPRRPRTMGA